MSAQQQAGCNSQGRRSKNERKKRKTEEERVILFQESSKEEKAIDPSSLSLSLLLLLTRSHSHSFFLIFTIDKREAFSTGAEKEGRKRKKRRPKTLSQQEKTMAIFSAGDLNGVGCLAGPDTGHSMDSPPRVLLGSISTPKKASPGLKLS